MKEQIKKHIKHIIREKMKKDGFYDGRFAPKRIQGERWEPSEDFDEYLDDHVEHHIEPSSHRISGSSE